MSQLIQPIFATFTILSALRHRIRPAQLWQTFRSMGMDLSPRTTFWLPILQKAALINQDFTPSGFTQQWLTWSSDAQTLHLLEAWKTCPNNRVQRMWRARLLRRLTFQHELQSSDKLLLPGLLALGMIEGEKLNTWGQTVISQRPTPSPTASAPWEINNNTLLIGYPVNWKLLWQLESFLIPIAPLTYSLGKKSLRRASQCGSPETLLDILQTGMGAPVPPEIRASILGQPSLKVSSGLVIEFSDPAELRQLRRSEPLRSHFERVLSARHVLVGEKDSGRLLKLLERRGIHVGSHPSNQAIRQSDLMDRSKAGARTHFSRAGLLDPIGEKVPILQFLQQSIRLQQAFDMLYTAPSAHLSQVGYDADRPEIHRITPMLIEERGGYTYLIAYSHTRRGQRTYRLDRMEVPGTTNLNAE